MNPQLSEQLRIFALTSLLGSGDLGITAERLTANARLHVDRNLTEPEVAAELRTQADKGWAARYTPAIGAERWRITAIGRSTAAEMGLG